MLPHIIRHNGRQVDAWYGDLVQSNGLVDGFANAGSAAGSLAEFVSRVSRRAGLAGTLTECGVEREHVPKLAAAAAKQWTGRFNPVQLTETDFGQLYEMAF
jgi:alcohol dehydrogenase class IV